jgi:type I restriction enzyme S subunit
LDEIADIKGGITKDKKRNPANCELLPYLRVANVQRGHLDLTEIKELPVPREDVQSLLLEPGDVLFNEGGDRDKLGRGWVWNGQIQRCVFQNHVFRARFHLPGSIEPKFISWYANTFGQDYFMAKGKQTTNLASINKTLLSAFPVPVAPLDQQRRIVAEIEKQFSRLDEAVANLKRVKANLKRYKAAVLKVAVEGRLVETEAELAHREGRSFETGEQLLQRILETRRSQWKGNAKYKEPSAPDTTDLPELPEGWVWATVEQLANVQLGKMLDRQKNQSGKELPYLRNINVRWDLVDSSDLLTMFFKDSELERYGLQTGDVLVCEGGEPGRAAIWDGRILGMMYQKAIHRVRFKTGYEQRLLVFYLEFLAKTGRLERWFTGSTIKHFTGESFAQLTIPVAPVAEQLRVVAEVDRRLSLIRETEAQVDANLRRAERLRQSILSWAFSGHLLAAGGLEHPMDVGDVPLPAVEPAHCAFVS